MFDYHDPSDLEGNQSLPVSPDNLSPAEGVESLAPQAQPQTRGAGSPRQERIRHLLYGSLAVIDRTIKILHLLGYANPNDWSEPMPVQSGDGGGMGQPHQWMVIMTKILLME